MRTHLGRLAAIALIAALASLSVAALAKETREPAADKPHDQQEKMRYCNAEAKKKELKGDERRAFMSSCLKG